MFVVRSEQAGWLDTGSACHQRQTQKDIKQRQQSLDVISRIFYDREKLTLETETDGGRGKVKWSQLQPASRKGNWP